MGAEPVVTDPQVSITQLLQQSVCVTASCSIILINGKPTFIE